MSTEQSAVGSSERRKVLMSAYACGPDSGSEPGAGWALARAAAQGNEVWVMTRARFEPAITHALTIEPDLARWLHPMYLSLSPRLEKAKKRPRDVYWYYYLWQRLASRVGGDLHARHNFDVGHHATFASDWLPCGLATIDRLPLVWGPVGGATRMTPTLLRWLGPRAVIGEVLREVFTGLARRRWGDWAASRSDVVVALNHDVQRRFSLSGAVVVVEPNSAVPAGPTVSRRCAAQEDRPRIAVFVGRIVGWKGLRLAVSSLARGDARGWVLEVYGEGPDLGGVQQLVDRLGLMDRVVFKGQQPREVVLEAFSRADVMLFPSMHDSAPWVVAEAVSRGCPAICLDRGGPAVLANGHSVVVPAHGDIIGALAAALKHPPPRFAPSDRWSPDRLPALLDLWYDTAVSGHSH